MTGVFHVQDAGRRWLINLALAMRSDGAHPRECAFHHHTRAFPISTMERRNRMLRTIIAGILLLTAANQVLAQMEPPEPYYDQQRKTWEYPLPPPPGFNPPFPEQRCQVRCTYDPMSRQDKCTSICD
jgi:hypothetical protein